MAHISRSRLLALAILGGILVAVISLAFRVESAYSANVLRIAEGRSTVARINAIAAQSAAVEAWQQDIRVAVGGAGFLQGETGSQTTADLQVTVGRMAEAHGVTLASFQILDPGEQDGEAAVALQMALQGTMPGIVGVIQAIEASKPYLFVERVRFRASRHSEVSEEVLIECQLEVRGFLPPPGGDQESGS